MTIVFNGSSVEVSAPATVGDLLAGSELRGVAVAVNGVVVPRHRHHAHPLGDGDLVEVVTAVQGG